MIEVQIPKFGDLKLEKLVLDYNGTIALDGALLPSIAKDLTELRDLLDIYIITADTHGTAQTQIGSLAHLQILKSSDHTAEKAEFVESLGASKVVAIGNGRNDRLMLSAAKVGIVVVQAEGAAAAAIQTADVVTKSIEDALGLLRFPKRLIATLRG